MGKEMEREKNLITLEINKIFIQLKSLIKI